MWDLCDEFMYNCDEFGERCWRWLIGGKIPPPPSCCKTTNPPSCCKTTNPPCCCKTTNPPSCSCCKTTNPPCRCKTTNLPSCSCCKTTNPPSCCKTTTTNPPSCKTTTTNPPSCKTTTTKPSSCKTTSKPKFIILLILLVFLIGFTIVVIFLILRPTKPKFILLDATVYAFNLSSPTVLTTALQITLSSQNPNDKISIFYDKVDVYATYRDQQITLPTLLPPTYQGHKEVDVWSPFVYGNAVTVAPYMAEALGEDQVFGTVLINVKVDGKVRWKVGTWVSGTYHLYVNCPAYIPVGSAIKFLLDRSCHVDV